MNHKSSILPTLIDSMARDSLVVECTGKSSA